ncbi:MAG: glycosyltransferase, partial [Gammaproteobacteria bacterium]|nr:glycosyltransferase [Gammaproteobacteria bacterium]
MNKDKVLIISHGHPAQSKGGAEIAAYNLYKELRSRDIDAMFLARSDRPSHGGSVFSTLGDEREILFHTGMNDFFNFTSNNKKHVWNDFRKLLESYRPDIVHFHHYSHMGLELIRVARNVLPEARIVLTLHEFLAICHHNGQMIKNGNGKARLCYKSSPTECADCFPQFSAGDFFLRKKYIQSFFDLVDVFISPSHFLQERYVEWGIPEDRIVMIENGQPAAPALEPRKLVNGDVRGRFAFFGQINPYKGIDVLLEAFRKLPYKYRKQAQLNIYGSGLEMQHPDFQGRINSLIEELGDACTYHGMYEPQQLDRLLMEADWVIVPSIWWENSPMVIQEAFNHRRP